MAGPLYGGSAMDEEPMDDMDMGSESEAFEPKDDEERAYVDAFPEKTFTEDTMAALKEAVRLCVEKNMAGEYDSGPSEEKPSGKGGGGLALIFGEPKKKR